MYDPSKENDKDVLREQRNFLLEQVKELRLKYEQKCIEQKIADKLNIKLSEELLNIRERVFNSKQEKRSSNKKQKKRIPTRVTRASKEKRLQAKRKQSQKKDLRKKPSEEE